HDARGSRRHTGVVRSKRLAKPSLGRKICAARAVAHDSSAVEFAQVRFPKSDEWSRLSSQSYRHIGAFHLRVGLTLCVTALTFLAAKVKPGRAVAGRTLGGVDRSLFGATARRVSATACRSSHAGPSAFTLTPRTSRSSAPREGVSAL